MKKIVLLSLMISVSSMAGQTTSPDIKSTATETNNTITDTQQAGVWLGVWIENISMSLGNHLLSVLKKDQGIMIKRISHNSPASEAGLKPYDIIAKFNDKDIYSQQQLTQLIRSAQPGSTVEFSLVHQGKMITVPITLAAMPVQNLNRGKNRGTMPGFGSWNQLPPALMNDPFFNSQGFNSGFSRDFNQRMEQEMNQLRQQMNQLQQSMHNQGKQNSWSQFESIQIESKGNNKHRAEIKYKDSDDNSQAFVFEGELNEIKQQIVANKEMDEEKKQQLLQALNMNNIPSFPFRPNHHRMPGWFNTPYPGQKWLPNN